MERRDVVHATVGCAGTIRIGMDQHAQVQEFYDLLSALFGPMLANWEQGDSLYIGVGTGRDPVDMPKRPKHRLRPSEARIQNGIDHLIELVGAVRSMDKPLSEQDYEWKPTKQARKRLETLVEYTLRGDARWRNEHPEAEW